MLAGAIEAAPALAASEPAIEAESAAEVSASSATLRAQIDPEGADTTYYFQYGPASCTASPGSCTDLPSAPGSDIGEGSEALNISVVARKLTAKTTYHYRVVASNEAGSVPGPEKTFTTQGTDTTFDLADGRMWEMVTPTNKQGAGLFAIGYEQGGAIQAAEDGGAITYTATAPFVENPSGSASPEMTQVLSKRVAPGQWSTEDITTEHNEGAFELAVGHSAEYKLFSSDLELGAVEPMNHTPLPPLPPGSEKTIYLRNGAGAFQALVTAENVPPGTEFGGNEEGAGGVEFITGTPNLEHVVISAKVPLTSAPLNPGWEEEEALLYVWTAGHLELASVLPNGEGDSANLGYDDKVVRHAISSDGSRVVWTTIGPSGHIYLRDMARGETIQIDTAQGVAEPPYFTSEYVAANSSVSRIFFTSTASLAPGADPSEGKPDLYEFEVTSGEGEPLAGTLTDLTVVQNAGEHADELGVIEASEDGSYVYFVANGVLGDAGEHGATDGDCEANGEASTQRCNLYVEHFDQASGSWEAPSYIATLSGADKPSWGFTRDLNQLTGRVSPNGRYLAFMSERSLTGYENRDTQSGVPDEEVYLYDAADGKLACASCNPTGAQPIGIYEGKAFDERLVDYAETWSERWIAGNVPGWNPRDLSTAIYQSDYLSNDGRLFFDSSDDLVPADVNGTEDVYEYEPVGVGGCVPPSYGESGSVVYSEAIGGCVALISSGTSAEESAFMGASANGSDVFFQTEAKLVPADQDTSFDLYDAHECSEAVPCAPAPASVPPPCTSTDACREAPQPQPSVFGTPPSATFSGTGNETPASKKAAQKKAKKSTTQLQRALERCAAEHAHSARKRRTCKQKARKKAQARKAAQGRRAAVRGGHTQTQGGTQEHNGSGRRGR